MFVLRRILVATDYSGPARRALDYAVFLARKFEASIELLNVWDMPVIVGTDGGLWAPGADPALLEKVLSDQARAGMEVFLRDVDTEGCKVGTRIERGHAGDTIVRVATAGNADLVVMGTHGRGALGRMFIGSVATYVVAKAPCPVVTVRLPESLGR